MGATGATADDANAGADRRTYSRATRQCPYAGSQ